ncbi:MAG TPA: methyltransferase [Acidimicrobiales bacterium]|nr:methyltransferase [Acidimicrobiales bacterium]
MTDTETLYEERRRRIEAAIAFEPVDQLPIAYMGMAFAPRYMGMSIADYCEIDQNNTDVTLAALDRMGADLWDGINAMPCGRIVPSLTSLWLSRIDSPGRELPPDSLWQVHEEEVMTPDDYDTILDRGWYAFLDEYLPRVIDPVELRQSQEWVRANIDPVKEQCRAHGYVPISFGSTSIPFEYLCGGRSMGRFFIDLYRDKDRVKAVMDEMLPHMIRSGISVARRSGIPAVWVGGWRSASSLIAPRIWDELVFPYFMEITHALAAEGIVSVLHLDQDWTRDLERFLELPPRMCLLNSDGMTDLRKARELLGDHMAFMGDVPSNLLASGTPDDVFEYVEALIRDIGRTGLILCPGCDVPINAKPENVVALARAGREFG